MAKKPHKFEWNGVDIDTVLAVSDIHAICAQAALESTGDLWNGKQRITEVGDGNGWVRYLIKDALMGWNKLMTFSVNTSTRDSRTQVKTTIESFVTVQQKAGFVPVSGKKMVAHHTYMQFVHKLANTVRASDPTARITIREGIQGQAAPTTLAPPVVTAQTPAPASTTPPDPPATSEPKPAHGLPPPPPPPPPPPAATADTTPELRPADDSIDDATRRVPRRPRAAVRWELVLPDGTPVPLTSSVVVGRDPATEDPTATTIAVPDDERTVSKTHAVFHITEGVVTVTDLHSGNGTFGVTPNGEEQECEPGSPLIVGANWTAELGDYAIKIRQRKARE